MTTMPVPTIGANDGWFNFSTPPHWASVSHLLDYSSVPPYVEGDDKYRIAAYGTYESIYWTHPKSFRLVMRGQEGEPIYIPSGRKVVETAHRYLAPEMKVIVDPAVGGPEQQTASGQLLADFLARERFYSRFGMNKRFGLMRGDWLWHLVADPEREPGSRISLYPLDPSLYFPEYEDGDPSNSRIAAHLVEATMDRDKPAVHKWSYYKMSGTGGPSPILVQETISPVDEWGQPGTTMDLKERVLNEYVLDAPIDQIPVYHCPNLEDDTIGWGSSGMRGVERLMQAVNQGITDEEITLVLEGLGMYWTNAGAPIDPETGEDAEWEIGPGRVAQIPTGTQFGRVNASGTVAPYQQHLNWLVDEIDDTTGSNDVTRGRVDQAVAESGIAIALKMAPLFSRLNEKELIITDVHNNLFFDVRRWFQAYEGLDGLEDIRWIVQYGDRLPLNKKEKFDQVVALLGTTPPVISIQEARRQLEALGWDFSVDDSEMLAQIVAAQGQVAASQADAVGLRINEDTGGLSG